jgi:hypothetical protein
MIKVIVKLFRNLIRWIYDSSVVHTDECILLSLEQSTHELIVITLEAKDGACEKIDFHGVIRKDIFPQLLGQTVRRTIKTSIMCNPVRSPIPLRTNCTVYSEQYILAVITGELAGEEWISKPLIRTIN